MSSELHAFTQLLIVEYIRQGMLAKTTYHKIKEIYVKDDKW